MAIQGIGFRKNTTRVYECTLTSNSQTFNAPDHDLDQYLLVSASMQALSANQGGVQGEILNNYQIKLEPDSDIGATTPSVTVVLSRKVAVKQLT